MTNRVGQQFGSYRLVRLLGHGGFAEVYLGEHQRLGTQAAVKVLYTHLLDYDTDAFLNEARTIAHLERPHIIRVFDFDVQEGIGLALFLQNSRLQTTQEVIGTAYYMAPTGNLIYSSPAVINGVVYVGSKDHMFYAFHLPGTIP